MIRSVPAFIPRLSLQKKTQQKRNNRSITCFIIQEEMNVCFTIYLSLLYSEISAEYTSDWLRRIPEELFALLLKEEKGRECSVAGCSVASHFILPLEFHRLFHGFAATCAPLLRQLHPPTHTHTYNFYVFFLLQHGRTLTHTRTFSKGAGVSEGGGVCQGSQAGSKAMCERERRYLAENSCPSLSLPLTPA